MFFHTILALAELKNENSVLLVEYDRNCKFKCKIRKQFFGSDQLIKVLIDHEPLLSCLDKKKRSLQVCLLQKRKRPNFKNFIVFM